MDNKNPFECANTNSILEAIYWLVSESGAFQKDSSIAELEQLFRLFEPLPDEEMDKITSAILRICCEHELDAFIEGIKVGFQLAHELE